MFKIFFRNYFEIVYRWRLLPDISLISLTILVDDMIDKHLMKWKKKNNPFHWILSLISSIPIYGDFERNDGRNKLVSVQYVNGTMNEMTDISFKLYEKNHYLSFCTYDHRRRSWENDILILDFRSHEYFSSIDIEDRMNYAVACFFISAKVIFRNSYLINLIHDFKDHTWGHQKTTSSFRSNMIDFQVMIGIIDEMILKTNCSDMNHIFWDRMNRQSRKKRCNFVRQWYRDYLKWIIITANYSECASHCKMSDSMIIIFDINNFHGRRYFIWLANIFLFLLSIERWLKILDFKIFIDDEVFFDKYRSKIITSCLVLRRSIVDSTLYEKATKEMKKAELMYWQVKRLHVIMTLAIVFSVHLMTSTVLIVNLSPN